MMTLIRLAYNDGNTTTKWYKTKGTMDLQLKELWPRAAKYISGFDSDGLRANGCKKLSEVLGIKITESPMDGRDRTMKALEWCDVWKVYAFARKERYIIRPYSAAPNLYELWDSERNATIKAHAFDAELKDERDSLNKWDRETRSLINGTPEFRYQRLGRLESDCRVFLDPESPWYKDPERLWSKDVDKHMRLMLDLWWSLDTKPDWINSAKIKELWRQMK